MKPRTTALALSGLLAGAGVLHLVRPQPFDQIVPRALPGSARTWTYVSGVAELAVAHLLSRSSSRRLGGAMAGALFVGVFPANVQMALDWHGKRMPYPAIGWGRLPLQAVLVAGAEQVRRHG